LNYSAIPEYISKFLDEWFTDTLNPETYKVMVDTANNYSKEKFETQALEAFQNLVAKRLKTLEEIKSKQEQ
jgi:hypothetical protein